MEFVIGIIIVICLIIGMGYAISSDDDDDNNFPNGGLGILDDDVALSLWELSQF